MSDLVETSMEANMKWGENVLLIRLINEDLLEARRDGHTQAPA